MAYAESQQRINEFRHQIGDLRRQMRQLLTATPAQPVSDYEFKDAGGTRKLSELFGEHDTLFVVHNMGRACMYCTLWADGFNGILPHLENRAAFVLSSPDTPEEQQAFAAEREWKFRMVNHAGTTFSDDMGYTGEHCLEPGISVFRRDGDSIVRVSDTPMGPYDEFCAVWHLFDLIPEGPDGWQPKYRYS